MGGLCEETSEKGRGGRKVERKGQWKNNKRSVGFQKITERRLNWHSHDMRKDEVHILRNVSRTDNNTREKEERTTKLKMEIHVSHSHEKYWTESRRGDGQGDME